LRETQLRTCGGNITKLLLSSREVVAEPVDNLIEVALPNCSNQQGQTDKTGEIRGFRANTKKRRR